MTRAIGVVLLSSCVAPCCLARQQVLDRQAACAPAACGASRSPTEPSRPSSTCRGRRASPRTTRAGRSSRSSATRPTTRAAGGTASITAAGGGGVLHFLVMMETPAAPSRAPSRSCAAIANDNEVKLRGPLVFSEGRYTLVSSVLNPSTATPERKLLATGRAPVLEGNRIAFSFDLSPTEATLLLRSLEMRTPDVSIVFDMTFTGLTEAYDADLTIDWTEVRKHQSFSAGGIGLLRGRRRRARLRRAAAATTRSSSDRAARTRPWRRCWTPSTASCSS